MMTLEIARPAFTLPRSIPRMLRQFLEKQEGVLADMHQFSPQLIAAIVNHTEEQHSLIIVYRDRQLATHRVNLGARDEKNQVKWPCRCGQIHLLRTVEILYTSHDRVRVRTGSQQVTSSCSQMTEEWVLRIPARPRQSRAQQFRQAAHRAMEHTRSRLPDRTGDHRRSRILKWSIDAKRQHARWWLFEHVDNEKHMASENAGVWQQAKLRYSLWSMKGTAVPQLLVVKIVTICRLQHRWSVFQQAQRHWIIDDLFAIVPDPDQVSLPASP